MWTQGRRSSFWKAGSNNFPSNATAPSSVACGVIAGRSDLHATQRHYHSSQDGLLARNSGDIITQGNGASLLPLPRADLRQIKHRAQGCAYRAVIGAGGHDVGHMAATSAGTLPSPPPHPNAPRIPSLHRRTVDGAVHQEKYCSDGRRAALESAPAQARSACAGVHTLDALRD